MQGAGAALIAPSALTLLMTLFGQEPWELTKALALYGAAAPVGGTAGVFLGGVLTDGLDWRWTLLINIPVAIAVLAATPALLTAGARRRERLDVVGSVLVTAALALAVFGIVDAGNAGWGSTQTVGVLAGALALMAAFIASQRLTRHAAPRARPQPTSRRSQQRLDLPRRSGSRSRPSTERRQRMCDD